MVAANFHPHLAVVVRVPADGSSFLMLVEVMVDKLRKIREPDHRFHRNIARLVTQRNPLAIRSKGKFSAICQRIVVSESIETPTAVNQQRNFLSLYHGKWRSLFMARAAPLRALPGATPASFRSCSLSVFFMRFSSSACWAVEEQLLTTDHNCCSSVDRSLKVLSDADSLGVCPVATFIHVSG